ncbi:MAG: hypothetical protein MZV70_02725 [Desulfobacterales bacterium]|nr:hypothetical protein [Desulfobacterales bacterium]
MGIAGWFVVTGPFWMSGGEIIRKAARSPLLDPALRRRLLRSGFFVQERRDGVSRRQAEEEVRHAGPSHVVS